MVSQGASIHLFNKEFSVPAALIGAEVEISFDPMDEGQVLVDFPGMETYTAHPLDIGERVSDETVKLPEYMTDTEPESSRFLQGLEKKRERRIRYTADAISFDAFRKEVTGDV